MINQTEMLGNITSYFGYAVTFVSIAIIIIFVVWILSNFMGGD